MSTFTFSFAIWIGLCFVAAVVAQENQTLSTKDAIKYVEQFEALEHIKDKLPAWLASLFAPLAESILRGKNDETLEAQFTDTVREVMPDYPVDKLVQELKSQVAVVNELLNKFKDMKALSGLAALKEYIDILKIILDLK